MKKIVDFVNSIKKKYNMLPVEIKAAGWFVLCNVLQRGIQFLITPIYTRILSTEEYGVYSLFLTWINFFAVFATLNLSGGIYYNGLIKKTYKIGEYTLSLQSLTTITALITFAFVSLLFPTLSGLIGIPYRFIPLAFLVLFFQPVHFFWLAEKKIVYEYKKMIVVTIFLSIITPLTGIILVYCFKNGAFGLACGYAISNSIVGVILYLRNIIRGKRLITSYWKNTLFLSLPLIPHYLSQILLGQSDRIMINYFSGKSDAGIYTLAYQIAMILYIVTSGVNDAYAPWMYKQLKYNAYEKIEYISNILLFSFSIIALPIILIAPEIVNFLGTEEYYSAVYVIPPVVISAISSVAYSMYGGILFFYEKTNYVSIASFSGAILNVVLNYLLIPKFGFIMAGITTVISSVVMMACNYCFMRIVCKKNRINAKVYRISVALSLVLALSLTSYIAIVIYPFTLIRYLIIIALIGIILWKKDDFISLFALLKENRNAS